MAWAVYKQRRSAKCRLFGRISGRFREFSFVASSPELVPQHVGFRAFPGKRIWLDIADGTSKVM